MDFKALREELRRQRERAGLTLDQLAQKSGLNRATIHSIENIRREPGLKPELETIERLVAAMGLTLSEFFLRLSPLNPAVPSGENLPSPITTNQRVEDARGIPVPGGGGGVPSNEFVHEAIIIGIAEKLADHFTAAIDRLTESRGQASAARARTPVRHGRGRKAG